MITWDDCDEAIIGYADDACSGSMRVVYDYDKLVEVFRAQFEGEEDARDMAVEWISFNIASTYLGPHTPILVYPGDRALVDEIADQE